MAEPGVGVTSLPNMSPADERPLPTFAYASRHLARVYGERPATMMVHPAFLCLLEC
jgi:hypothetical protein